MSAHIVFAVPCLWQGGIHSLQGLPSILLIKQWLCTQPIQGRENATQRDKNIKHLAIWGGRVPNNDSSVIMEAQFFSSTATSTKKKRKKRRNSVTTDLVFLCHCLDYFILCEKEKKMTWNCVELCKKKKKNLHLKYANWFKTPLPTLN